MPSNNTVETTQRTQFPAWVEEAQKALGTTGLGMISPFLQSPQYSRAGMTEDQLMAGNLARKSAVGAFDNNYAGRLASAGQGYTPATGTAARLGGTDYEEFFNPFLDRVVNNATNRMRSEKDSAIAQSDAQAANGVAFGGSGSALRNAQIARGYTQDVGELSSNLMAQGYDRANALASQNVDREQAMNLANLAAKNQAGQFNASQGLSALLGANNAENDAFNRQQTALATLLGYGNRTQSEAQANLDIPWANLQRGMSIIPGVTGSTINTAPDNSPSFLQQLLGAGLAVGGMGVTGGGSLAGNWLSGLLK